MLMLFQASLNVQSKKRERNNQKRQTKRTKQGNKVTFLADTIRILTVSLDNDSISILVAGSVLAVESAVQKIKEIASDIKSVSSSIPYERCIWGKLKILQQKFNLSENLSLSLIPAQDTIELIASTTSSGLPEAEAVIARLVDIKLRHIPFHDRASFSKAQSIVEEEKQQLENSLDVFILIRDMKSMLSLWRIEN